MRCSEALAPGKHSLEFSFAYQGLGVGTLAFNSVAHIDLKTGKRQELVLPEGDLVGEPIFVPRSKDAPEGDGYLIALIYRAATNQSELLILNAQDITGRPEAVLKVPRRVPQGFHGNWAPGV